MPPNEKSITSGFIISVDLWRDFIANKKPVPAKKNIPLAIQLNLELIIKVDDSANLSQGRPASWTKVANRYNTE